MSNSSQPTKLYQGFEAKDIESLIKECTIDLSDVTSTSTTVVGASDYSYTYDTNSMSTITLSPSPSITTISGISTTNTISIDSSPFTWKMPTEWVDCFPEWGRVEDMCKKYPGLEIAFRNFQTVYQLVKDDYDNPTPKK